jgi:hypothetical protein
MKPSSRASKQASEPFGSTFLLFDQILGSRWGHENEQDFFEPGLLVRPFRVRPNPRQQQVGHENDRNFVIQEWCPNSGCK